MVGPQEGLETTKYGVTSVTFYVGVLFGPIKCDDVASRRIFRFILQFRRPAELALAAKTWALKDNGRGLAPFYIIFLGVNSAPFHCRYSLLHLCFLLIAFFSRAPGSCRKEATWGE